MNHKAIIFDMDGLLVDSEVVWHVAEVDLFEAHGYAYTDEVRAQIIGMRLDEMFVKLHGILGFEESPLALAHELNERMLELIPQMVKPQPGALELVAYVVEQNIPRAIASSSPLSIINATVGAMGWDTIFTTRCTADDEAAGKPAPDVYLAAARRLGFAPSDCLTLEDSPTGARAAVAAGMTCYAVPDQSHSSPAAFAQITPHVFGSLHEVLALLRQ
ncbi:MAG: HAD family phosphatase [Chitinophagaceae bacterium]|nr:HAD family phosphatase [Anaerolineae bacterium]